MYLKEIDVNTRKWLNSAQDMNYWKALENAALNLCVPQAIELFSPYPMTFGEI